MRRVAVCMLFAILCAVAPATTGASVHADRDRDKVFDDLETQLTRVDAADLVSLEDEASTARLERINDAVGDLGHVTRLRAGRRVRGHRDAGADPCARPPLGRGPRRGGRQGVEFGVTAQNAFGVTRAREDIPGLDGEGVVAAVLDSGIDTTMPDLPPSR